MHGVARRVMLDAQRLDPALGLAQPCDLGLEVHRRLLQIALNARARVGCFLTPHEPQKMLRRLQRRFEFTEARRHRGLRLKVLELLGQFLQHVVHAREILAGVFQA